MFDAFYFGFRLLLLQWKVSFLPCHCLTKVQVPSAKKELIPREFDTLWGTHVDPENHVCFIFGEKNTSSSLVKTPSPVPY